MPEQIEPSQQEKQVEQKQKKLIKMNLYASCLLLSVFVIMLVATTIAYFTDKKQVTNTFTSGNVELELSESAVKLDEHGNYVIDTSKSRINGTADSVIHDYGRVYPAQTIYKDPTVHNPGDTAEWVAVKVILTDGAGDLNKLIGYPGFEQVDIELLLSGGLLAEKTYVHDWNGFENVCYNDNYMMIQKANKAAGVYEFYFLMQKPLQPGKSVLIFDELKFQPQWNNSDMQELAELKIHIQAFGVQTLGLDSCFEAMTSAFPEHFKFS